MKVALRDYQNEALEALREHIRHGRRRAVLSAPTGSGKTVIASALCQAAVEKGSRTVFAVDRIALVEQTSARLHEAGIEHGVVQGDNCRRVWSPLIVASQQTLEKRKTGIEDYDLIIVDECHTQRRAFTDWLRKSEAVTIGLSATPFSSGLAETYDAVVNARTTDRLVEDGWLIAPDVMNGTPADLGQAKKARNGEWTASSIEKACSRIVGDVLVEWENHAEKHFDGVLPPTLVFTPTIAYGEALCKLAHSRGHVWEQVTAYTPEEERSGKIEGFREGKVRGLVGCASGTSRVSTCRLPPAGFRRGPTRRRSRPSSSRSAGSCAPTTARQRRCGSTTSGISSGSSRRSRSSGHRGATS